MANIAQSKARVPYLSRDSHQELYILSYKPSGSGYVHNLDSGLDFGLDHGLTAIQSGSALSVLYLKMF